MLEEFTGQVLVDRFFARQLEGDREHRAAVKRHPRRSVGLIEDGAVGKLLVAIEDADVVQPKEPAAEDVAAGHVFSIHPPGEIDDELLKRALEERD